MDDESDDGRTLVVEVEVWACNLPALGVFQLCPVDGIGAGMGGIAWTGIAPTEIRAACALKRIAPSEWPDIADDVHYMGGAVAEERNRRAAAEAKRKR